MARQSKKDVLLAEKIWDRYSSSMIRGHATYQTTAKKNEDFYLGAGRQWTTAQKEALDAQGKPWLEPNLIFSVINTVLGYQTQSRLDIAYKPRETDDQDLADLLSKISMHILDQNHYPWEETQVFSDGVIQARGFFDIRLDFDDNMYGNIKITAKDPLDIIPDPDAKTYDPDDWADVVETRWMTLDDIEENYGRGKMLRVASKIENDPDFGIGEIGSERNKFSDPATVQAYVHDDAGIKHVRVLERQWWKLEMLEYFMDNETGDLREVPEGMSNKDKNETSKANDYTLVKRMSKRVRWTVSTKDIVLHDDWSPYRHFTIVPYFPYFRRGVTLGLIDNLISTQEMLNKTMSQILHTVNSSANSGWLVEENSLTNMDIEDLEDIGAQTGLVIEYKTGRKEPEKIKHNEIPTGLSNLAETAATLINTISGVSDIFQGQKGPEVTGVAIQSRVQQNAVQLATPIDNLYRSRHMLAQRILELVQDFYTEERIFSITRVNPDTQEEETKVVTINQYDDEAGAYLNDTTSGKYDVVISDVPNQVTFQNAQFSQAIEMRKFGIEIPDDEMILLSTLSRKNELAKKMSGRGNEEQEKAAMQQMQLELESLKKELAKVQADTANKNVATTKNAVEIAEKLAENPSLAVIAQGIIKSAGMEEEEEEKEEAAPPGPGQELTPEDQLRMQEEQRAFQMREETQ